MVLPRASETGMAQPMAVMTFFDIVNKFGRRATARMLTDASQAAGGLRSIGEAAVRRAYDGRTRPSERIMDACEALALREGFRFNRRSTLIEWDSRRTAFRAQPPDVDVDDAEGEAVAQP